MSKTSLKRPRSEWNATDLLLKAGAWKREGRPDRDKYRRPYTHNELTLKQSKNAIGCTVWDGSIVLARFLESQNATLLTGKRVVELGSGAQALPGMVAATLGASSVVLSDSGNLVMDLLKENVETNTKSGALAQGVVSVADFFWGNNVGASFGQDATFDCILVAECMYVPEAVEPLIRSLKQLSSPETVTYISYGRNRSCADEFIDKATESGFQVEELPFDEWHPDFIDPSCSIIKLKLQPSTLDAVAPSLGNPMLTKNKKKRKSKSRKEHQ